ncbi:uncharacterized protein LOC109714610 [Ananas comosus]|uniref:Uncharacterized protein LOC109714610 n=1 Tax=Ananas comosus TaxID=4615 RepID=A0A6P5FN40_ANACO|nr:uncharacterized protein LOC109714610 [Ananas comosus]
MLHSAIVQLITHSSAANSLVAFFICHLIIAVLLLSAAMSDPLLVKQRDEREPVDSLEEGDGDAGCKEGDEVEDDASDELREDDELKEKAEQFIERMNRLWRAENTSLHLQLVGYQCRHIDA